MGKLTDSDRDTADRETRFEMLRRVGEFVRGIREREPLPDGVEDAA